MAACIVLLNVRYSRRLCGQRASLPPVKKNTQLPPRTEEKHGNKKQSFSPCLSEEEEKTSSMLQTLPVSKNLLPIELCCFSGIKKPLAVALDCEMWPLFKSVFGSEEVFGTANAQLERLRQEYE